MITNEATSSENPETKSVAPAEGQKLAGCYLLKARVGGTGAGELWQANDEVLGRDISLQFIPDKIRADAKAVGDIRHEIKRNRQLIHPNILRVYDFIEEPEWAAVSMDSFEGESLATVIEKRSSKIFSPKEIEPWITQLCQTLDEAHKIGLFHRDISASNIYFRPDGNLFLTGFGFSRCVSDAGRRLDESQNAISANMSPQLLDGQPPAKTDDIYACGELLFELLTGQAPFSGPEIVDEIRNVTPKPVSELRPKDLEPVPENWEKAIAACLSKNPAERPPSAGKLAERLTAPSVVEAPVVEAAPEAPAVAAVPVAVAAVAAAAEVKEPEVAPQEASLSKEYSAEAPAPADPPAAGPTPASTSASTSEAPEPAASAPEPTPAPAAEAAVAPSKTPAPAPASPSPFGLGRRTIATTADPSASAPLPRSFAEKTAAAEESVPPKTTRPKTTKPDPYSSIYGERPRLPIGGIVAGAVAVLALGVLGYHFLGSHKENPPENPIAAVTPAPSTPPENGDVKLAENPAGKTSPGDGVKTSPPGETPTGQSPETTGKSNVPPTEAHISGVLPTPAPKTNGSPAENALAQKQAELDKTRQALEKAQKFVGDLAKQQEAAEAAVAATQKALDEKAKNLTPAKKAVDELAAKKKKLEDDQKAADAAAMVAKQVADEKRRLADVARTAVDDFDSKNQDKLGTLEKADAELAELKKTLEDKQQAAVAAAKARSEADDNRAKLAEAEKASEQGVATATAAVAAAQQASVAKQEEARKLDEDMLKLQELMKQIKERREAIANGAPVPPSPTPNAPSLATPPPITPSTPPRSTPMKSTPVSTPLRQAPISSATPAASPYSSSLDLAPLPKATPEMAKLEGPKVNFGAGPSETAPMTAGGGNSLGQKFVPVGDVDFCIWQTRVKDFETFARDVALKSVGWRSPGFKQGPDHPVVNVTWQEAVAFCKWLTEKEHKEGSLPANQFYRLPTDLEWSKAVGLPEEPEKTPAERDMVITDVYPWGKDWPPPPGAGNYTGEETGSDVAIKGYNDGFAWTSPVGSFKPNKYGIYDMGGNVWQWCMDSWNDKSTGKVLRGASWYNGALKLSLLSSCRVHAAPDSSTDNYGFRIVKATDGSRGSKK